MKTTKKEKQSTVKETVSIILNVPNELYYSIKKKADKDTYLTGQKKSIHDKMIDQLQSQN